jgi:DNA-binding response OmpR family regulator/anti-sigma regulatory factor (Ser/Thr protein kinase)
MIEETNRSILVVDDTDASRYTICRYLQKAGFDVWEAATGEEALRLAKKAPDLITLDVKLPDVGGYEVCRRLKEDALTASIPVLEISAAFRSTSDRIKGLDSGADGYLTGPVDPDELLANVKLLLRLRESERHLQKAQERLREHARELETKVKERTTELARANEQFQSQIDERKRIEQSRDTLLRQLGNAQEDERRRISRELHDEMGQHMAALLLKLKALGDSLPGNARARKLLPPVQKLAVLMGEKLHWIAFDLRPASLDDLGLLSTLKNYVATWSERTGIQVDFQSVGRMNRRLSREIETTLYRVVQEALHNVAKHSKATRVDVILEYHDGQVQAIVEDNGRGFDLDGFMKSNGAAGRLGLAGMNERVTLVGGTFSLESNSGRGTTVFARTPLNPS